MSEMWQGVLLGALISVPLSLAMNLLSSVLQRKIDRRGEEKAAARAREDAAFRAKAAALATDRSSLYIELLETLLRVAYFTAIFGVLSGAFFALGQLIGFSFIPSSLGQISALVGALVVLNIVRPAVALLREVRAARGSSELA